HLGPEGSVLERFASSYVTERHGTEWGKRINFDGADSVPVREFFVENAAYWIDEYHLDGLRLDATDQIFDGCPRHVLAEIAARTRAVAAPRAIYLTAENDAQDARLLRSPDRGGHGLDAAWNDDFHHSAFVAATGRSEAYHGDTAGTPQELISAARWGYLFQGQHHRWQRRRRGTLAFDLPAISFVHYLENHDQVANSAHGARLSELTSPGRLRALTALLLLSPATPLLFQGQESGAKTPFVFFADLHPDLLADVTAGRHRFLS